MDLKKESYRVVILTGKNWLAWKFQMTIILKAKGLHEVILKTPEKDEEKDNKAQELIVTRVEESILTYIMTCKTACEMWSKLNTIFESQSECSVHLNQQKNFNLKFEPPMAKFIAVVEEIVNRLRVQKEEMPEKKLGSLSRSLLLLL
ncbi:Uncharacterized protein OBRU01_26501 [Operophtera brumata]|uniref:Copia protein n=1 Tax=Operophtera brumata TaxID=104452 RepID=A0A0L7K3P7_OPEBR|nr:Uncharacterized protein OBRU01_26501 [Operophtera brumata]